MFSKENDVLQRARLASWLVGFKVENLTSMRYSEPCSRDITGTATMRLQGRRSNGTMGNLTDRFHVMFNITQQVNLVGLIGQDLRRSSSSLLAASSASLRASKL
ncbi:hypothetical protein CBL_11830 [Carabus blaptoides fortunei]